MTNQINLNNAIAKLQQAMLSATCDSNTATYWTGLLGKQYTLHSGGTVQRTMSNPLAYFVVPLAGDGTKGRSHEYTISQFTYALSKGWTNKAHECLRGVNELAIRDGMAFARPRLDSNLGTVEGRLAASMISAQSSPKARKDGSKLVTTLESAKQGNDRVTFENASLSLAAIIEKYSKPATAKPATAKPATTKPKAA